MNVFGVEILATFHQVCLSEWWVVVEGGGRGERGEGGENDQKKKTEFKLSHPTKTSTRDEGKSKFAWTQVSAVV